MAACNQPDQEFQLLVKIYIDIRTGIPARCLLQQEEAAFGMNLNFVEFISAPPFCSTARIRPSRPQYRWSRTSLASVAEASL